MRLLALQDGEDIGIRQLLALRDFWSSRGEAGPAIAATRWLLDRRTQTLGRDHPDTLIEIAALGALLQRSGQEVEGGRLLQAAWQSLRSVAGGRDLRVAIVAQNLAAWRVRQGDRDEATFALEIAYRIRQQVAPESNGLVAAQLAELKIASGKAADAVPLLVEALERTAQAEGTSSPRTLVRAQMLGTVLNQLGRHKEASLALKPVYGSLSAGADPERRAAVAFELGLALDRTGAKEEGLRRVEESVRLTRTLPESPVLAIRLTLLARMQVERGRPEEAEGLLLECLEIERRTQGDRSAAVAERYASLGGFYMSLSRADEALGWLDAAASLLQTALGAEDPRTKAVAETQIKLLADQIEAAVGRRDRQLALALARRATELGAPVLGHGHQAMRRIRELRDKHRLDG